MVNTAYLREHGDLLHMEVKKFPFQNAAKRLDWGANRNSRADFLIGLPLTPNVSLTPQTGVRKFAYNI